jgi:nucleotidyltransferase/DNA polymerase involved in DNA repair
MTMKQDNLTRLKHVGSSRMKLFNDLGITTIRQLYEMPMEKLAQIKSIGGHYAKLIKDSVTEYYREEHEKLPGKTLSPKEKRSKEINRNLRKQIKRLKKRLTLLHEDLKPLGQKKYLQLFMDFKQRSNKLNSLLRAVEQIQGDLPNKIKKSIIKKADALNSNLKDVSKKPKKKEYKKIIQEIQSFSKKLMGIDPRT